jgi:hypothetical protein
VDATKSDSLASQRAPVIRLSLTVPCDARVRQVAHQVSRRIAEYIGFQPGDAEDVARTVEEATDGVLDHPDGAYAGVELTFMTTETLMEIRIRYLRAEPQGAAPGEPGVEAILGRPRPDEAPLDLMRRVMTRVEFGRIDDTEYCMLVRALPEEWQ